MLAMIRLSLVCLVLSFSPTAQAAELSPWFGSTDQTPFQLDPTTMVAVTFAADPLQTGSLSKLPCKAETCTPAMNTAKSKSTAVRTPQY